MVDEEPRDLELFGGEIGADTATAGCEVKRRIFWISAMIEQQLDVLDRAELRGDLERQRLSAPERMRSAPPPCRA